MTLGTTGSTGRLGGRVARSLAAAGVAQRLLVRDPSRAPRLAGATAVPGSYADREAVTAALRGLRTVLMVSASESPDRMDQHRAFIDAAAEVGVQQVVYSKSSPVIRRPRWPTCSAGGPRPTDTRRESWVLASRTARKP